MIDAMLLGESSDPLLLAIEANARDRGLKAAIVSHDKFVESVTITTNNNGWTVHPEVPLLLRPFFSRSTPELSDGNMRFLAGERLAVLWAAAFLSRARVINRPSTTAIPGRACFEVAVDFRRSTLTSKASGPVRTSYGSRSTELPNRPLAIRNLETGITWLGDARKGAEESAVFARDTLGSEWYERVTVVDRTAWSDASPVTAPLGVQQASIRLCADLGLDFATVTWEVDPLLVKCLLVRVDPYPSISHLEPHLKAVAAALVGVLMR